MRSWLVAGIGLLLVIGFAASHMMRISTEQPAVAVTRDAGTEAANIRQATRFLDLLDAGAYEEALGMANPEVAGGLGSGKIRMIWEGLPTRLGPRLSRGAVSVLRKEGRTILGSRLQFRDQAMDVRILLDPRNLIAGFQLEPVRAPSH